MKAVLVRLPGITILNFENTVHWTLSFENPKRDYSASILGLYGQNDSERWH